MAGLHRTDTLSARDGVRKLCVVSEYADGCAATVAQGSEWAACHCRIVVSSGGLADVRQVAAWVPRIAQERARKPMGHREQQVGHQGPARGLSVHVCRRALLWFNSCNAIVALHGWRAAAREQMDRIRAQTVALTVWLRSRLAVSFMRIRASTQHQRALEMSSEWGSG